MGVDDAHVGEPSVAEDHVEAGVLNGVAYATLLFLVFISKHNLPFRYCTLVYLLCVACKGNRNYEAP